MNVPFGWLDRIEADALVTDRYLDGLLAAADRRATDTPAAADLDPALRRVARAIAGGALRVHPSFRFEERLARRLAEAAAAARPRLAAAGAGAGSPVVVAFESTADGRPGGDPEADRGPLPVRPLLVGGALTSAALSIAGAAFVAWRIARAGGWAGTDTMPLPATPDLLRRLD